MPKPKFSPLPPLRPLLPSGINHAGPSKVKRPVKGGIPFFRDQGHTGPTRGLYRSLLRNTKPSGSLAQVSVSAQGPTFHHAQSEGDVVDWAAIRRNIRQEWKKRKGLTSIPQTNTFLSTQHDLLSRLTTTNPDLITLSHNLAERQAQADARSIPKPTPKPYLAGYLRPTHFHPPLPRLKPQPISLTLMIKKRIAARARRLEVQRHLLETGHDIQAEMGLMRNLRVREGLDEMKGFWREVGVMKEVVQRGYERDEDRKAGIFGLGVVRRVEAARRGRQEWKRLRAAEKREAGSAAREKTVQTSSNNQ